MLRLTPLLALLTLAGCKHTFPLPYTVEQLTADSARWPGDALVHYLSQESADPGVCTARALERLDEELAEPFVESLREGTLGPERWTACAKLLVPALPAALREFTLGRLARLVLALLEDEQGAARLIAIDEVLSSRPREPSRSLDALLNRLGELPRERLPSTLPPVFDALLGTLELERGQLRAKPVTEADIEAAQDDLLLLRMAARLPDEGLRLGARRRLVRLRIARSDWPEVKARAAEVERAVLDTGRWAQRAHASPLEHPELPLALPFEAWVKQDVAQQTAALVVPGRQHQELVPAVALRPHLRFPVGFSRPLGLCRPPEVMDVAPCVDVREVEFQGLGAVDDEGVLRLPEQLSMAQAVEAARAGAGLTVSVRFGGKLVTSLTVPVHFLTPASSYFHGREGQRGPAVNVVVQSLGELFVLEGVSEADVRRLVVVPREASARFEFGSRGGDGADGADGWSGQDGSRGFNGSSASCPATPATSGGNGANGGPGGNGGDGGPGGAGGPVEAELRCVGPCGPEDVEAARRMVVSRGGPGGLGGRGGRGGSGGSGGRGGTGTTCTIGSGTQATTQSLPGASDGFRGSDGPSGFDGSSGPDGPDGVVTFR